MQTARFKIGIDTGTATGVAVLDVAAKKLIVVETMKIYQALIYVRSLDEDIFVRVEDARKRKWFGKAGREQLQGAGSIKRDAKIWEDFLTDYNIPHEMVAPIKGATKWDAKLFSKVTGWQGRTTQHSRDAALLVFRS